jgi:hypothetical protein
LFLAKGQDFDQVRVVQAGDNLDFALKTLRPQGVAAKLGGQDFQGDFAGGGGFCQVNDTVTPSA